MRYHVLDEPVEYPHNGWCDCGSFVERDGPEGYFDGWGSAVCDE